MTMLRTLIYTIGGVNFGLLCWAAVGGCFATVSWLIVLWRASQPTWQTQTIVEAGALPGTTVERKLTGMGEWLWRLTVFWTWLPLVILLVRALSVALAWVALHLVLVVAVVVFVAIAVAAWLYWGYIRRHPRPVPVVLEQEPLPHNPVPTGPVPPAAVTAPAPAEIWSAPKGPQWDAHTLSER